MSTSTPPFFKDYEPPPSSTVQQAPPGRSRWPLVLLGVLVGVSLVAATVLVVVLVRDSGSPRVGGLAPPPSAYDQAYGTFEPVTTSGSGDARIALPAGASAGIVTVRADGPGLFDIGFQSPSGNQVRSLLGLARVPTPYAGTVTFGLQLGAKRQVLHVWTDGPWQVTIGPVSSAPVLDAETRGTGPAVYRYDGDAAEWAVTHEGQGGFVVQQWRAGSTTGLQLAIGKGPFRSTTVSLPGPSVVVVFTRDSWSITP